MVLNEGESCLSSWIKWNYTCAFWNRCLNLNKTFIRTTSSFTLNLYSRRTRQRTSNKCDLLFIRLHMSSQWLLSEVFGSISAGIQSHIPTGWFWSDLPFSIHMDTRDLNRVWCVAAVLAFDPRLSGGPRWQRVKVKGKGDGDGDGDGACGASDGCKGSLSGSARTQTVPDVYLKGWRCRVFRSPRPTLSVPTHLRGPGGGTRGRWCLEYCRGKRFPGWRERGANLNITNLSDKHKHTDVKFNF